MAELNASPEKNGDKKVRKTNNLRVDLTAMVDLAFLLVTFFMLTTTLTKPRAMDLAMPVDGPSDPVPQSRTVTLCLGKDNKVLLYQGMPEKATPSVLDFSKNGLRKALLDVKERIYAATGKDVVVLVKPSNHSVYGNLVNTLDELNISQNSRYAIVDISAQDIDMLKKQSIY
ncbi:biopolymer transporter ExbD [Mucilaginibacter sp. PAMB04168]|uniref:biopolymer transporter ExbD n=1 Tax=Mucilaginibacter sp. PAMB04168 TaxID=3138567 RepID=UPI0031F667E1